MTQIATTNVDMNKVSRSTKLALRRLETQVCKTLDGCKTMDEELFFLGNLWIDLTRMLMDADLGGWWINPERLHAMINEIRQFQVLEQAEPLNGTVN